MHSNYSSAHVSENTLTLEAVCTFDNHNTHVVIYTITIHTHTYMLALSSSMRHCARLGYNITK
jgi:hypothetical protein